MGVFDGRRTWIAILAVLAGAVSACGGSGSAATTPPAAAAAVDRDATLRIGLTVSPTTWDPLEWATAGSAAQFISYVYDQLIEFGTDLKPKPMLAESWGLTGDGMSMILNLRPNVKFQDGSPLDASAVKANLERAKANPTYAGAMAAVEAVDSLSPLSVRIRFLSPSFNFVDKLAQDVRVASVVNPKMFGDPTLRTTPAGSGPYRLVTASQQGATYERVDGHWDPTSGLAKRVEVRALPDPNARLNALRSGQLDMVTVTADQVAAARASGVKLIELKDSTSIQGLLINYTGAAASDWRVRKAISLAIDRKAIAQTAFAGTCQPTQQLFTELSGSWIESGDSEAALRPDVDAAKALLAEAGVSSWSISVVVIAGNTANGNAAQLIQQQLAPLNIEVKLAAQPVPQVVISFSDGQFDGFATVTTGVADSYGVIDANLNTGGKGFGLPDYIAPQVAAADRTPLGAERLAAFKAVNQLLVDRPAHVLICRQLGFVGASEKVVGAETMARGRLNPNVFDARRVGVSE